MSQLQYSTSIKLPRAYQDLGCGAIAGLMSGHRLHLQQGPINVVLQAWGEAGAVDLAYERASQQFPHILPSLVANLDVLRRDHRLNLVSSEVLGPTSSAMVAAVKPYEHSFVTPMAAVAGAVADRILAILSSVTGVRKAYVNNGGDIAVYLQAGESMDVGVVPSLSAALVDAKISISEQLDIGGMATSGWQGHSYSMGVADSVTVLARNAAAADVAATLIANHVNVTDPAIERRPAQQLDAEQDLGERLVTTAVGLLSDNAKKSALDKGLAYASELQNKGLIHSALISLQGAWRVVGKDDSVSPMRLR